MAGQLTIDTLKASSGVLATQNGMTGIAKAWVQFQGGNGNTSGTINAAFNVSSITVNGTGDYTCNFTTAMPDTYYSALGCGDTNSGVAPQHIQVFWNVTGNAASAPTTNGFRLANTYSGNGVNTATICLAVFR